METRLNKLTDFSWEDVDEIIIFGYGRYGSRVFPFLKKDFNIVAIVDNDEKKWGQNIDGIKIKSFQQARCLLHKFKIIITVQAFFYTQISKQLEEEGLIENLDYVLWSGFFPEWYYRFKKKICVEKTDVVVTSFCNLNCESCSAFMPYVKGKKHEDVADIEKSLHLFFERVDFVQDMNLYGGETFLHPKLCDIVRAVGKYRDKIGYLGLITNGTIIPDKRIIDILKTYDVGVSISDYSVSVDYKDRLEKLCGILEENRINVIRTVNMIWFDIGFPRKKICLNEEEAIAHMNCCNTACHDLIDEKIYYCVADRAAQLGGLIPCSSKSYVDLKEIDPYDLESRRKILELCAGNICGGYLDFCKMCGGFGSDNPDEIPAGKQISRM